MRNRKAVAVGILAAVVALTVCGWFSMAMAGPVLEVKQAKWRDVAAGNLSADTTFITDENDTTRTQAISTLDWDWGAIMAGCGGTSGGGVAARVFFVSTTATNNGVTDTLYFTVEKGVPGKDAASDTLFSYNGSLVANTAGACAISEGTAGAGVNVWSGVLMADPDTPGANNIWLAPKFRLKVAGDQSGTSPKVSGVKCFIVYPKRQESQ